LSNGAAPSQAANVAPGGGAHTVTSKPCTEGSLIVTTDQNLAWLGPTPKTVLSYLLIRLSLARSDAESLKDAPIIILPLLRTAT
jgi:hypothetical protein